MWINFKRIFKLGFVNFWRNGLVSAASVLAMTVTLFVIGGLYLAGNYLESAMSEIKSKVDISISFKEEAPEGDIVALQKDLQLLPEVKDVGYSSADKELADFRERHKDNETIIQSLGEVDNPFGARLNIMAVDPSQYDKIARFVTDKTDPAFGGKAIVYQISYKKDVIGKLVNLIKTGEKVGWGISIVLGLLSILAVFNTVSLAIYTSREEISVMRLVGAGSSYVKGPFMIEGVMTGVIASFIALVALYPAVIVVRDATAGIFGGINLVSFYLSNFGWLLAMLLVLGVFLGLVASYWASRKYAKI